MPLRRSLSLFDLTMIAIGSTIDSGISLSVFLFRRRKPDAERPYRTAGYPVTPVIFLTVAILFVFNTLIEPPLESGIGLGFLALGVPVYYFWSRRLIQTK